MPSYNTGRMPNRDPKRPFTLEREDGDQWSRGQQAALAFSLFTIGLGLVAVYARSATSKGSAQGSSAEGSSAERVKRTTTIERSPEELYRAWRDFERLPRFMTHLESVRVIDDRRSHWIAKGPAGKTFEWDAEITDDVRHERIAWRSTGQADVPNRGSVRFTPATGGRGTVVTLDFSYHPPGGKIGAAVATLFGEEPGQQAQEDLRRFKQLMEAGELPTIQGQSSGRTQ